MRKLVASIFLILFFCLSLFSQRSNRSATTRAVVIGISNYQDDKIADLKFSHKDAEAFVDFLKSNAGGNVPDDQIKLLTNEDATAAQIFRYLDWLIDDSKEGDQVMIYFSGHGDVETKTVRQRGYLLAHDTPFNNYRVGAIGLDDINDILATLSQANKSKIILITDACRSGNLAGKKINGTQATASALASQFANEIKIMSCQPNEFALEGEQWGGGRGLFSFHFIEGLIGMADGDDNLQVNLKEIGRYLEDRVSEEAAPESQIPMTIGNKTTRLSFVDEDLLALLKEKKEQQPAQANSLASKAPKSNFLAGADSTILEMYQDFVSAIDDKYFLPSNINENREPGKSASELYDVLSQNEEIEPMHNLMKGNFAAALQDESQQAIIAYLNVDQDELKKRYLNFGAEYQSNPAYLAKAAELLGSEHYLYEKLLAKQYYFEGLIYRLNGQRDAQVTLYDTAFVREQLALQYDDQAAFIYNELGMIKQYLGDYQDAIPFFDSAMVKAPTWALPPTNLMNVYRKLRWHEKADSMGRKALELKPDYYQVYFLLALNYKLQNKLEKAKEMNIKALHINPNSVIANFNLGLLYFDEGQHELARSHYEKSIAADSSYFRGYWSLGAYYVKVGKRDSAIVEYQKAIALNPNEIGIYTSLAYQYMYTNQFQKAKETLEGMNVIESDFVEYHFAWACCHALEGNTNEALIELEKAIQKGIKQDRIESDSDLDSIRSSEQYIQLMNQYFPDQ